MSIFPKTPLDFEINDYEKEETFKEYAINFDTFEMLYKNGKAIILEGAEALKVWIYKAMKTTKYRYKAYNTFGNEFENIIGESYPESLTKTLLEGLMKESLFQNEFINDISNFNVEIEGGKINISASVITAFGEVNIDV